MEKGKIDRINALAKKAKTEKLTAEEEAERKQLREEYLTDFRSNLTRSLKNVYLVDENGGTRQLQKKKTHPRGCCGQHTHHHHHHHEHNEDCQCGHHHDKKK